MKTEERVRLTRVKKQKTREKVRKSIKKSEKEICARRLRASAVCRSWNDWRGW